MSVIFVDYPRPDTEQPSSVCGQDTDGSFFDTEGYTISLVIPTTSVSALLDAYDASNQYSPSAADSRAIARTVLDALKSLDED
jgi:hypothetical protein